MKLGTLSRLENSNTMTEKNDDTTYWQIMMSSSVYWFMANLEQSRSQIPDAWSTILFNYWWAFFYLLLRSHNIALIGNHYNICLKTLTFFKKMLTLATFMVLQHYEVYFLKLHICLHLWTTFKHNPNRWGWGVE